MKPSGIVTFTTDFGLTDDYVGLLHGAIYRVSPDVKIVNLCHNLVPGEIHAAAFLLLHDHAQFPAGTVHVAVVDPGVGTHREVLAAQIGDQYFLAPNNGLLHPLLEMGPVHEIRKVTNEDLFYKPISKTFHGRDIFSPVAAKLATGMPLSEVGPVTEEWQKLSLVHPEEEPAGYNGRVMLVDRFGNLITNLPPEALENHTVQIAGFRPRFVGTFSEGNPGETVCLIGSKQTVEVVINGGDAAKILGLGVGTTVRALAND